MEVLEVNRTKSMKYGINFAKQLGFGITNGSSGISTATFTYTYNQIGNMLSNPQVGAYTYPTSGAGVVRPHAATVVGPYPLTYDNNGNLLTLTDPAGFYGYNATYNVDNRMSSVVTTYAGTPTTSTFVYDGDGGRVKKIDGTTTTRYISKLYECDTTGANTSCSRFIWAGDTRVATVAVTSGTVHYWHGNHLGSSSVITDSTGAKVQALTYYPYGDVRTNQSFTTPAVNVPYKFTGKELDFSSNLYFYEARYYHPVFGRFISPDTLVPNPRDPQDLNRYTYAGNNPLKYTDPSGHFKIKFTKFFKRAFGNVGTTLLGAAVGAFTNCWTCAMAIMSQSESGRYVSTSVIVGAAAVGTVFCAGTCAPATGMLIGSVVGSAFGGYSAAQNGGDLSSGLFFGSSIGAITGGIAGGITPVGAAFDGLSDLGKILAAGKAGALYGGGTGAAQGFAGGKGSIDDVFQNAGIGLGIGFVTAAGLQAVAPPLSELAGGIGKIKIPDTDVTLKKVYDAIGNLGNIHASLPNRLDPLAINAGQFLDVNRALILGGGAALGTGAAFNYGQVLPFVQEKCAVASPCTPVKREF